MQFRPCPIGDTVGGRCALLDCPSSADGELALIDCLTGNVLRTRRIEGSPLTVIGENGIAADRSGCLFEWDVPSDPSKAVVLTPFTPNPMLSPNPPSVVAIGPQRTFVAAAAEGSSLSVMLLDVSVHTAERVFQSRNDESGPLSFRCAAFAPQNDCVVCGTDSAEYVKYEISAEAVCKEEAADGEWCLCDLHVR